MKLGMGIGMVFPTGVHNRLGKGKSSGIGSSMKPGGLGNPRD